MLKVILKSLLHVLQGAIVGVGAILPGISGGVLCVVFGIYEPMMEVLSHPFRSFKKHCGMLIPFALGWALGFVLLAKVVEFVFSLCQPAALMLFFGLICGTLPEMLVSKEQEKGNTSKSWMPFVISLSFAYLLFHLVEVGVKGTLAPSFLSFVFCGVLWGLSTIVPGMTSSAILIELGLYEPLTGGIGSLQLDVLIPFLIGIIATVLLLARLIHMLYQKHNLLMCRVILGFVIASSLKILPTDFLSPTVMIVSLVCFVVGFAAARAMDVWSARHHHH